MHLSSIRIKSKSRGGCPYLILPEVNSKVLPLPPITLIEAEPGNISLANTPYQPQPSIF